MMQVRHIALGIALAGPASALTPLPPPCAYGEDQVDGRQITYTTREANQFVTYEAYTKRQQVLLYLEHCPSGKILRSKSAPDSVQPDSPRSPSSVLDTVEAVLTSDQPYTMGDIQRVLKEQGVATRRFTSKAESCACQHYFPDARGSKAPYEMGQ